MRCVREVREKKIPVITKPKTACFCGDGEVVGKTVEKRRNPTGIREAEAKASRGKKSVGTTRSGASASALLTVQAATENENIAKYRLIFARGCRTRTRAPSPMLAMAAAVIRANCGFI
jgi:hypothetical protein